MATPVNDIIIESLLSAETHALTLSYSVRAGRQRTLLRALDATRISFSPTFSMDLRNSYWPQRVDQQSFYVRTTGTEMRPWECLPICPR
jgi:hypothetical protein